MELEMKFKIGDETEDNFNRLKEVVLQLGFNASHHIGDYPSLLIKKFENKDK